MAHSESRAHRRTRRPAIAFALPLVLAACSGGSGAHQRFVAVHNAYEALGLGQVGHITEGSLAEGGTVRLPMELNPGCYTFVGLGSDGVRDIDVTVTDANGQRAAGDTSHDAQAATQFCPSARGTYTVTLRMASGGGAYVLGTWSGSARGAGANAGAGEATAGTCATPTPITLGQTVTGSTTNVRHQQSGSCADGEAGEAVYALTLERRMLVTVAAEQDYDGAIYIRQRCDDGESEVACNDDDNDTHHSRISRALDPGTWYIFADGFSDNTGGFSLTVTGQDVPSPQEVCQQAPVLQPGQAITGTAGNTPDTFQSRQCGARAPGPDHVYRLEVPQESRVQIYQETDYDGVLYLRRACTEQASEVACNDDAGDTAHSRISQVLPAGTYFVFSDAYSASVSGNYTLQADLAPVAGSGVAGDSCNDALPLTPGTNVEGSTFSARDDVQSPCAAAADGYDMVYRLDVPNRSRVRLWLDSPDLGSHAALYLTRSCAPGQANAAVQCRGNAVGTANAIDQTLERGQYFVVVDSTQPRAFGRFTLHSELQDTTEMERACRAARPLVSGRTVRGTTAGADHFNSNTCAGGSHSAENLYRLTIRQRSHVRIALETTAHDGSLYLRRDCMQAPTEVACNDDAGDTRHSLIEQELDPGTYTVFVDGYSNGNVGAYELTATVSRP